MESDTFEDDLAFARAILLVNKKSVLFKKNRGDNLRRHGNLDLQFDTIGNKLITLFAL
jgi:hypothetical protein